MIVDMSGSAFDMRSVGSNLVAWLLAATSSSAVVAIETGRGDSPTAMVLVTQQMGLV